MLRAAGGLAFAVLALAGASPAARDAAPRIVDGVASGDVSARSAVVWARATRATTMHAELLSRGRVVARGKAKTRIDATAQVRFTRLRPATRYTYRVWFGLRRRFVQGGSFRTPPSAAQRPRPLTLVLGADVGGQTRCRNAADGGYRIFEQLTRVHPDGLIANGDFVYADNVCPAAGAQWQNIPGDFASDLDVDWNDVPVTRQAVFGHWRYNRADPYLQALLRTTPVYAQWDDHEVANDFGGPWTYLNASTQGRTGYPNLVAVGREAFFAYWPISTRSPRVYRSFRLGKDAALFLLDDRSYRARNDEPDSPQKSMLGRAQLRWLENGLARSTATWKLVSTDVPLFIPTCNASGCDSFASGGTTTGFERELLSLLRFLDTHRVRNVVFLTTDVHFAETLRAQVDVNGDGRPLVFHELIDGPLSAIALQVATPDADVAGVPVKLDSLYAEGGIFTFEVVRVARLGSVPHLVAEVRGADGAVRPGSTLDLSGR